MLGVEAVDNIMFGTKELTLTHPDVVNGGKDSGLRYRRHSCGGVGKATTGSGGSARGSGSGGGLRCATPASGGC
jgi:hypothetical protein